MLVGLAMGTTVSIGQAIGSKDKKRVAEGIGNTVILFMGSCPCADDCAALLTKPIVTVMSTHTGSSNERYLTICFIGIPLLQHIILSVQFFRGMGDSKRVRCTLLPLHVQQILSWIMYLSADCILDRQVPSGTTCAQVISVMISLVMIIRQREKFSLGRKISDRTEM